MHLFGRISRIGDIQSDGQAAITVKAMNDEAIIAYMSAYPNTKPMEQSQIVMQKIGALQFWGKPEAFPIGSKIGGDIEIIESTRKPAMHKDGKGGLKQRVYGEPRVDEKDRPVKDANGDTVFDEVLVEGKLLPLDQVTFTWSTITAWDPKIEPSTLLPAPTKLP